jgi:hypothetical protein
MVTRRDLLFILGASVRAGRAPTARADSSSTRSSRRPILIATTDTQKRDASSAGPFTNMCQVATNNGRESYEILYLLTREFIF